ncbi:hypothetical protein P152DRAFT_479130 [Eremomyces bilateralis CBS 781.70]|uniref:Secreted protein n=1 Tax=Eremomyces bilateralis CBS 781.70 TaxID=1392243 RepID=A0A6G1GF00_9PEZI|nr:uncharacterized protein P152DRAFT_479130 [Eremomyces bilateralis CBS 781.70]KAF1816623.1 hypothetical protein P152DRAFT_479130 [Eremomyces bilateralis CBS 781.70]
MLALPLFVLPLLISVAFVALGSVTTDPSRRGVTLHEMPDNFTVVPAEWTGQIFKNGPEVTLFGDTTSDIFDYIEEQNPEYDVHFPVSTREKTPDGPPGYNPDGPWLVGELVKCPEKSGGPSTPECPGSLCGQGFARAFAIEEGIKYLKSKRYHAWHGPHSYGQCHRLTCSWNSAIYFCNNKDEPQLVPWSEIGGLADQTLQLCRQGDKVRGTHLQPHWLYAVRINANQGPGC